MPHVIDAPVIAGRVTKPPVLRLVPLPAFVCQHLPRLHAPLHSSGPEGGFKYPLATPRLVHVCMCCKAPGYSCMTTSLWLASGFRLCCCARTKAMGGHSTQALAPAAPLAQQPSQPAYAFCQHASRGQQGQQPARQPNHTRALPDSPRPTSPAHTPVYPQLLRSSLP